MLSSFFLGMMPRIAAAKSFHRVCRTAALLLFISQGIPRTQEVSVSPLSSLWQVSSVSAASLPATLAQSPVVLASGQFVTITPGEDTSGTAQIIREGNRIKVRLAANFSTNEGPDVKLLLHKENPPKNYNTGNYILLGDLKKFTGEQVYEIPPGINWQAFPHVIVWCQKFNVTFAAASLK